jgi:hypothetical protein
MRKARLRAPSVMLTAAGAPRSVFSTQLQPGGTVVTKDLEALIEAARKVQPSPDQEEEQRRSFAFGNGLRELLNNEGNGRQAG